MRILVQNALLVTMDDYHEVIENGALVIDGGKLSYFGPVEQVPVGPFERVIDSRRLIAIPGMVNAHCHSPADLVRGLLTPRPSF